LPSSSGCSQSDRIQPLGAPLNKNIARVVAGDSFDALAAAHSRALTKVSAAIAAVIRTEAGTK